MSIKIKKIGNTLVIKLPQNYDILVEGEIIDLTKKSDEFLNIKNIIIDCTLWDNWYICVVILLHINLFISAVKIDSVINFFYFCGKSHT